MFTELVAAIVSALLGTSWGLQVVWYGLLEGAGARAGLRLLRLPALRPGRWRRWRAAPAGLAAGLLDWFYYYRDWASGWIAAYVGLVVASSAIIAGLGGVALVRALASTGALDAFPSGRDRTLV